MAKKHHPLLKGMDFANGRYVYRPYIKQQERAKLPEQYSVGSNGRLKPPILLGDKEISQASLYLKYQEVIEELKYEQSKNETWGYHTLGWLYEAYTESRFFKELSPTTQKLYGKVSGILEHPIKIGGQNAKLGDIPADKLTTIIIRNVLDKRLDNYQKEGLKGESRCNNEKALLSSMYAYGIQYHEFLTKLKNPIHGVKKFKVKARTRYVTEEEYQIQYQYAESMTTRPYLAVAMELAYLLACRGVEVTDLTIEDATEEGVKVKRRKGSKSTIIEWDDRLKAAWDAALAMHRIEPLPTSKLLVGKGGHAVTRDALSKGWQKLKELMRTTEHKDIYFVMHDLKGKAITDAEDDKLAGHVSDSTRAKYNKKPQSFKSPAAKK